MKIANHSGRSVVIAFVLGCAGAMGACGGDDTTPPPATGGSSGSGGNLTGGSGGARDGGTGGARDGGTGGTAGQGGSTGGAAGTGGVQTDAGTDVRTDTSAGGSAGSDASDVVIRNDATDATVTSDARDATPDSPATSDASDAVAASDVTDAGAASEGDGLVCPVPSDGGGDGGEAGLHVQLYSFDLVDGGATGIADWSTYEPAPAPPVMSSGDDFNLACTSAPGSIHAQLTFAFGGFNSDTRVERGYFGGASGNRPDWSAFTRIHWWIKVTSPASSIQQLMPYVVDNASNGPYAPFFDAASGTTEIPNLAALCDSNWHELVTTIRNTSGTPINPADILKFGIQVRAPMQPADAATGPDGAVLPPAPVDVYLDNIWLE